MNRIKPFTAKILSKITHYQNKKWIKNPFDAQKKILKDLLRNARGTLFSKDHDLDKVKNYEDLKKAIPIRNYEQLSPYIHRILEGQSNILRIGRPLYLLKTSGTTYGKKYIPLTKEGLDHQLKGAKEAILNYIYQSKKADFLKGNSLFLQGSPLLSCLSDIKIGRLSGIIARHIPFYLKGQYFPKWKTNIIEDWSTKIDAIVEETQFKKMSLISGIPPWIKMYFERLQEKSGKKVGELFPSLSLIITGGVNYAPYQRVIDESIGRQVDIIQTYPASEGFIAYQYEQEKEGLILLLNQGIFYEFIPKEYYHLSDPPRFNLEEIELGVDYVLILNTDSGLWGYEIGDVIRFIEKDPYRIIFIGRTKEFSSAFGEHLIAYEVETTLKEVSRKHNCSIVGFTIAPQVNPVHGLPYHDWYIEFNTCPLDLNAFSYDINQTLRKKNPYYDDLIKGEVIRALIIRKLKKGAINNYMKSIGKLGGQFKLSHLSNDRKIADGISLYEEK